MHQLRSADEDISLDTASILASADYSSPIYTGEIA